MVCVYMYIYTCECFLTFIAFLPYFLVTPWKKGNSVFTLTLTALNLKGLLSLINLPLPPTSPPSNSCSLLIRPSSQPVITHQRCSVSYCCAQGTNICTQCKECRARCQREDMETPLSPGSSGAGLGMCWARMPTPSPNLQSTGPQRESRSVVDGRQPGEEL